MKKIFFTLLFGASILTLRAQYMGDMANIYNLNPSQPSAGYDNGTDMSGSISLYKNDFSQSGANAIMRNDISVNAGDFYNNLPSMLMPNTNLSGSSILSPHYFSSQSSRDVTNTQNYLKHSSTPNRSYTPPATNLFNFMQLYNLF